MKYFKIIAAGFIFFSCNNEPKQPETVAVDSTIYMPESGGGQRSWEQRKVSPPLGMQGVSEGEQAMARGALPRGVQKYVLKGTPGKEDTLILTTIKKQFIYYSTDSTIKKFAGPTPPPPPPVNKPPVPNAGADKSITLPTNSIALIGTATDPDGTIASYAWTKISGGAATIKTVGAAQTVVEGMVQGLYSFRLTVKDNGGLSASDDVNVTVNPATPPPPPPPTTGFLSLPLSGAMDLSGKSNVIVENKRFRNISGIAIKLYSGANNITIRNCFFDGASGELVELENASNITIENCLFARGLAGVYAVGSKNVKIINCQFVNMKIRYNNGNFAGRGVFVQMNSCDGGEVTNCRGENFDGESDPEDMISCYGGSSNIRISGNILRGGKIGGPSTSGGGIIVGDFGGTNCIIENNTLLNPGQYGLAIAGGRFNKILNNKVFSERTEVSNNPLYVANYSGSIGCSDITVTGNRVNWTDKTGSINNGWNSGQCGNTPYNPSNNGTITLGEMNVPTHLITFVSPAELLLIRK